MNITDDANQTSIHHGFAISGTLGIFLNLIVFQSLAHCKLSIGTLILMRFHCVTNVLGLLAKVITFVVSGVELSAYLFNMTINTQFVLHVVMALHTYFAFRKEKMTPKLFNKNLTCIYGACCIMYGTIHSLLFNETNLGESHRMRYLAFSIDLTEYSAIFICYGLSICQIRKQCHGIEKLKRETKQKRQVFGQFFTVACIWTTILMFCHTINFSQSPSFELIQCFHFILFTVDPVVYLIFNGKLRDNIWLTLCCQKEEESTGIEVKDTNALSMYNHACKVQPIMRSSPKRIKPSVTRMVVVAEIH